MQYLTIKPDEMKALEQQWMRETGIPGILLMEHAAQGVVAALKRYADKGRVLFLCGPGNNGGDGYAAARLWQAAGGSSVIWELTDQQKGDAALNRSLCLAENGRIPIRTLNEERLPSDGPFDAVVDALFGTGLSRPLEGMAGALAYTTHMWHQSGIPIIAVDIPSGLDGTTGKALGVTVPADETVTFHRIKQGLVLGDSADYVGRLTVQPILIPQDFGEETVCDPLHVMTADRLPLLPARKPSAHKGSFGKAVLFVGSMGMAGAAALCARAAIRSGAGLTYILARASIVPILQTLVPGAVCVPLPERDGRLTDEAAAMAADKLRGADAAAIGCGLGQTDDLLPMLRVFREADCRVVWDADALNLLAAHRELLPLPAKDFITPHPGEAARLLGCAAGEVLADGLTSIRRLHEVCGCGVLLKGARTLMTDGVNLAVNITGTPAMAKGGSGDVLTGILTALIAQQACSGEIIFAPQLCQMQLAALAHGLAGLRAERLYGQHHIMPEQLCDCIRFDTEGMNE